MKKLFVGLLLALAVVAAGCDSAADKVNTNLGKECEKFNCQRLIVGVNGITDKLIFKVEGRCSIEDGQGLPSAYTVTCKHGPKDYRKHFVTKSDNMTLVSTQLKGIDVSEYRTTIVLKPENIVPNFDLVTGEQP